LAGSADPEIADIPTHGGKAAPVFCVLKAANKGPIIGWC
jgi:hypothetical protein